MQTNPSNTVPANLGEHIDQERRKWLDTLLSTHEGAQFRDAMRRPTVSNPIGRFVVIVTTSDRTQVLGIWTAEYNVQTKALAIASQHWKDGIDPERLPNPFRSLVTAPELAVAIITVKIAAQPQP